MIVELYAKSDVGRIRRGNEDNFLVVDLNSELTWSGLERTDPPTGLTRFELQDKGLVLAVSDGMGGALAGDVASRMAIDSVREMLMEDYAQNWHQGASLVDGLKNAAGYANLAIHLRSQEDASFAGMGATLTAAGVTYDNALDLVQIGDSRAYILRKDQIRLATKDQSLVQQLVDVGQISEAEAETHMFRNVILQALGAQNDIVAVTGCVRLRRGDTLLLCSDGLSGKLRANEMYNIIAEHSDLATACDELIALANEKGGEDNVTVILARFTGDDLEEPGSDRITIELPPLDHEERTLEDDDEDVIR